jgi:hypothetical protein
MHKGIVTDDRRPAGQRWGQTMAAVLVALIAGSVLGWAVAWNVSKSAEPGIVVMATQPRVASTERVGEVGATSARALAQHRAFYAQQLANEVDLEQWVRLAAPVVKASPVQHAFYAQLMTSEAALEGWSTSMRGQRASETDQPPRQVLNGVQFE